MALTIPVKLCLEVLKNYTSKILSYKVLKRKKCDGFRQPITDLHGRLNSISDNSFHVDESEILILMLTVIESNETLLIGPSLDCLQKLISYNFFQNILIKFSKETTFLRKLIDEIFKFHSGINIKQSNENIELSIIKVFTSLLNMGGPPTPTLELWHIVKFLIHVVSTSRFPSNRSAAKAFLTSFVMNIFQNLESADTGTPIPPSPVPSTYSSIELHSQISNCDGTSLHETTSLEQDDISASLRQNNDEQFTVFSTEEYISDYNKIFSDSMEYNLDCNNIPLFNAFVIFEKLCCHSVVSQKMLATPSSIPFASICLEMVHVSLDNADSIFRKNDCFLDVTRRYLFTAITQPFILSTRGLFTTCLCIFLLIIEKFRSTFKYQIQVFFEKIIFKILETPPQPYDRLGFTLNELKYVCRSSEFMSIVFVNYDCVMESRNIFERLVDDFCSIAKNPSIILHFPTSFSPQEIDIIQNTIRLASLSRIVDILTILKNRAQEPYFQIPPKNNSEITESVGIPKNLSNQNSLSAVKERKDLYEEGIKLFNFKPLDGLRFLIDHDFLTDDPDSIADFLHQEERLDPNQIGQVLGRAEPKWLAVMHKYVEKIDIKDLDFLPALRLFLYKFRLPGEGQKIDRLMEKFASHYCESNPNSEYFMIADVAYLLAYSIIMLTTDLYSPKVKHKITSSQYIEMNHNPDGTTNFPDEYLLKIYDSIRKNEIKLKSGISDGHLAVESESLIDPTISSDLSKIAKMSLSGQKQMSSASDSFVEEIETSDATRSMFITIWKQLLVCLGWVIKETNDQNTIYQCLNCIILCVRISCLYNLELTRRTFISSLLPFSLLSKCSVNLQDLKSKNIAVIRAIIFIAREDGNFLADSWQEILVIISNLQILQYSKKSHTRSSSLSLLFDVKEVPRQPIKYNKLEEASNGESFQILTEISSQKLIVSMDHIFTNSVTFDADAIVRFVSKLCEVAKAELFQSDPPRPFTLQKILEVAYYNINRTRIVWNKIWSILSPFLIEVSSFEDEKISLFCIDSIRQLSCKFLERKEFRNFNFQSEFFKPFEHIIIHNRYNSVRELGLRCILNIICSYGKNIRSGWKIVINIITHACSYNEPELEEIAFSSLSAIVEECFESAAAWFDDVLQCVVIFSFSANCEKINSRALKLFDVFFQKFGKCENIDKLFSGDAFSSYSTEQLRWELGWKKIMLILIRVIHESNSKNRAEAIYVLFNILKLHAPEFSHELWRNIFKILHGILHVVEHEDFTCATHSKLAQLDEMSKGVLAGIFSLFVNNYENLSFDITNDFFDHLKWCVSTKLADIPLASLFIFKRIIVGIYSSFDDNTWEIVNSFIEHFFLVTTTTYFFKILVNGDENSKHGQIQTLEIPPKNLKVDYTACYDPKSLIENLPVVENDSKFNSNYRDILTGLTFCKVDLLFLESLQFFMQCNTSENLNINYENMEIIFYSMSEAHLMKLLETITHHRKTIQFFNDDTELIFETANRIQESDVSLKLEHEGKLYPNMCLQEIAASRCAVKLISLISYKISYSETHFEYFSTTLYKILSRYNNLYIQCADEDKLDDLLGAIFFFLTTIPDKLFLKYIIVLYKHIWPLIKFLHSKDVTDRLSNLFGRLEVTIGLITIE